MPKVNTDWRDLIYEDADSTTGWSVEMHLRTAAGAEPAIAKFSTAAGTMLVGQASPAGNTNGIRMNALKASMTFAAGTYYLDLIRTDGGRNEDLLQGDIYQWQFILPITNTSLT